MRCYLIMQTFPSIGRLWLRLPRMSACPVGIVCRGFGLPGVVGWSRRVGWILLLVAQRESTECLLVVTSASGRNSSIESCALNGFVEVPRCDRIYMCRSDAPSYIAIHPSPRLHTPARNLGINITQRPSKRIHQLLDRRFRRKNPSRHVNNILQGRLWRGLNPKDRRSIHDKRPLRRILVLPRPVDPVDGCVVEPEDGVTGGDEEILYPSVRIPLRFDV